MTNYLTRTLEASLRQAAQDFPAVLVTGPRQSGKTTLLQHVFGASHRFVSLDEPDIRALAVSDPRLFMSQFAPPVILDEIQYAPELLHYVKSDIDAHRSAKGRYVLSGSQNLPLMQNLTETLAGRAAVLTLLSMAQNEKNRQPHTPPFWEGAPDQLVSSAPSGQTKSGEETMAGLLRSGFPELVVEPNRDHRAWLAAYIQTYLERDVRNIRHIGNLADFQRFLLALAGRTAQLLNVSEIARDIGIAANTAKAWLSILEASFQIVLLKPYFANLGKRLVKTPKLYFLDTAIPAYLAGLAEPKHALLGPMGGALFENAVFAELYRAFVHRGEAPRIFFWRTADGQEVDFILDLGPRLVPIEVKLSATPTPAMAANLLAFRALFPKPAGPGYLICLGAPLRQLADDVTVAPFGAL
jgi:predicted AAA+ superfamily ATPase